MKTLFDPTARQEVERRIAALTPQSSRQWGRMTPHQAVCHLNDSFKAILGDRPLPMKPVGIKRWVMRVFAFTLPMPWPKGVQTSPEVDAEQGGTAPEDFQADVADLLSLVSRFVASDGRTLARHYVWGDLSRGEWGRYGYRHLDHHLRQFGV